MYRLLSLVFINFRPIINAPICLVILQYLFRTFLIEDRQHTDENTVDLKIFIA
mgnify:CR=1 FL=1